MKPAPIALALLVLALPPAPAQEARTLRLTFIGDIMAHDQNYRMDDFGDIYRGVSDIFLSDDLTIANLEMPVDSSRDESGYPLFNGSPAYVKAALDAGVDVFSLANNHSFDGGLEGIFQTLRTFAGLQNPSRPFWTSGIRGNPRQAFFPTILAVRGVRVGFLALTQFLNVPGGGRWVNVLDYGNDAAVEGLLRMVKAARSSVDLLIVSWHGDTEYSQRPTPGKRAFFHRLLGAGAQIVFSHHPHMVQGYEVTRTGGGEGLIMYSMGNFISAMTWDVVPSQAGLFMAATGEAYLLSVTVQLDVDGCSVRDARPIPIANYRNERGEMVVARLQGLADGSIPTGPGWRGYFARRLSIMKEFLGRSVAHEVAAARVPPSR